MFGNMLIVICTLMQAYVFWRAASVPFVRRHVSRKVIIGVCLALWAVFVISTLLSHSNLGTAGAALEFFGMNWLAALFLIFICLFAMDVVTGFGFFFRRIAPSLRGVALAGGVILSTIALVQGMRPPVVRQYEIKLSGLPAELDGAVLVALSDVHLGSLLGEQWLAARVAQVQSLHPDVIVLLGDLVEGHGAPPGKFLAGLSGLSAPLGVWAVPGNHEAHGSGNGTAQVAEQGRVQVLANRWAEVSPGLVLAGVEDLTGASHSGNSKDMIAQALQGRPPGVTVLLSHTPWETENAARKGVGLMLCGHTHGGQIWPFGYLVATRYPLLAGRYEVGDMTVLVCRGTGTWGPRMRLWLPAEILRVTLRSKR